MIYPNVGIMVFAASLFGMLVYEDGV